MATTKNIAIYPAAANAPGGYDETYTTMAAFESGEDGDISGGGTDLYLNVEIVESDGSWDGAPDTDNAIFDGWKCDRSNGNYITITAVGGARSSDGSWDTTAYYLTNGASYCIRIDNDTNSSNFLDIDFDGIQLAPSSTARGFQTYSGSYDNLVSFEYGYINCNQEGGTSYPLQSSSATIELRVKNCIIEGGNYSYVENTTDDVFMINNTITEGARGIRDLDGSVVTLINNAVFNTADDDITGTFLVENYNASDDLGGSNPVDLGDAVASWNAAFTNYAAGDFSLKDTNSVLYHAGLDPNSESEIPSDDIAGNERPTGGNAVSIGAYEWAEEAEEGTIIPLTTAYYERIRRVSGD